MTAAPFPSRLHRRARVPVARQLLAARPMRAVLGAGGVSLALMRVLLIYGLWAGVHQRATPFGDHVEADLLVLPAGSRTLFADPGSLSATILTDVATMPGVHRVASPRASYLILEFSEGKGAVAAVALDPGSSIRGAWAFASGRGPQSAVRSPRVNWPWTLCGRAAQRHDRGVAPRAGTSGDGRGSDARSSAGSPG